jgi:hypothetical protein
MNVISSQSLDIKGEPITIIEYLDENSNTMYSASHDNDSNWLTDRSLPVTSSYSSGFDLKMEISRYITLNS